MLSKRTKLIIKALCVTSMVLAFTAAIVNLQARQAIWAETRAVFTPYLHVIHGSEAIRYEGTEIDPVETDSYVSESYVNESYVNESYVNESDGYYGYATLMAPPFPALPGDAELLARVIWAEARGECRNGWLLVAQTVLDRAAIGGWGNTIYSVVNARSQFVVFRGNPQTTRCGRNRPYLWYSILETAESVLAGERYTMYHYILFFRSRVTHNRDWWAPFIGRIGAHAYYGYPRAVAAYLHDYL